MNKKMKKKDKLKEKELNSGKYDVAYLKILKKYFGYLRKHWVVLTFLLFFASFSQALGIGENYLFKILIDKAGEFGAGTILASGFTQVVLLLLFSFIALKLFALMSTWFELKLQGKLSANLVYEIKKDHYGHIVDLDHEFHTNNKTGSLISRISRTNNFVDSFNQIVVWDVAPFFIQAIALSVIFAYFSWVQSVVLILFSALYIITNLVISKRFGKYRNAHIAASDREKAVLADSLTNINSVKYFGKEGYIRRFFDRFSRKDRDADLDAWGFWKRASVVTNFMRGLGVIVLLWIPIHAFIQGEITVGVLTFVYSSYIGYLGALRKFSQSFHRLSKVTADMGMLFQYMDNQRKVKNKSGAKNLKIARGEVEFDNISFKYTKRNVFKDFNLKIKPNEKVALVGHSGCGKSTLVNLLYRLYDVNEGKIKIDGKDIKDFRQESVRNEMAIVPQEAVLFDDTIWNNVRFSNTSASVSDVWKAIRFAQLDKIIEEMPKKEHTIVGERGVKLSGGEKQRVSIARAILANKKVLVLDEATSALDSETEHEIQHDLERLMKGRTSIIIAHRLSTIMHADRIVVMDKGKIVEIGTHKQLIRRNGEYKKLWNLQKGGYIK